MAKGVDNIEDNCGALDYLQSGIDGCMGHMTQAKLRQALKKGGQHAALELAKQLNLAEKAAIEKNLKES